MKLQFAPAFPDERLVLTVPGVTAHDLTLFQRYLSEELQQKRDLKEIALTIVQTFLEAGDRDFLTWKKRQDGQANPGVMGGKRKGNARVTPDTPKDINS